MKGVTKPVTLTTTKFGCYMSPIFKAQVCGGDFVTQIDRTQWGVDLSGRYGDDESCRYKIRAGSV